ncbi:MAG: MFS transporter [Planctomycetia bacterium]|nr:MFS transporter [Planctomycetia bacterium]
MSRPLDASPVPTGWGTLRLLNRYHWFVFTVAALGWLADCMDQQLFNLGRVSAVRELLISEMGLAQSLKDGTATKEQTDRLDVGVKNWASWSTSIFLMGWATGGIFFGVMGDRWGRVKTMLLTILLYSLFTGLSALSVGVLDFAFYRFLTGLGVGGEFAVGVALLAEVMPAPARPFTLGLLQAFSAFGNVTAALLFMLGGYLQSQGFFEGKSLFGFPLTPWRVLFVVGTLPALLALLVRRNLDEPEAWKRQVADGSIRKAGSYREMLGKEPWRTRALAGLALAFSGVVGLWAISFFSIDLQRYIFDKSLTAQGLTGKELAGAKEYYAGVTSLVLQLGAFCGMFAFSTITPYLGRKLTFVLFLLLAAGTTALVFLQLNTVSDILWMVPLMGFCQLALFGGYAIYFPELFPTRLRSTGTSFCYNVGRFIAAAGPPMLSYLATVTFVGFKTEAQPELHFRYAGLAMCSVYAIGLIALWFLPETNGKPLPESDTPLDVAPTNFRIVASGVTR